MLHKLHRMSAIVIGAYVLVHILNHLVALGGVPTHIAFMEGFRHVYRFLPVEILLLVCVTYQVGSGIRFVVKRWGQRRGFFDRLQAISGGYIAFFLGVHVSAVLVGRISGLDTNFYFAAAGMHIFPVYFFFVPYYFLAVSAFFAHIACAFVWLARKRVADRKRNRIAYGIISVGLAIAGIIALTFAGGFYVVEIPAEYAATYQG